MTLTYFCGPKINCNIQLQSNIIWEPSLHYVRVLWHFLKYPSHHRDIFSTYMKGKLPFSDPSPPPPFVLTYYKYGSMEKVFHNNYKLALWKGKLLAFAYVILIGVEWFDISSLLQPYFNLKRGRRTLLPLVAVSGPPERIGT